MCDPVFVESLLIEEPLPARDAYVTPRVRVRAAVFCQCCPMTK